MIGIGVNRTFFELGEPCEPSRLYRETPLQRRRLSDVPAPGWWWPPRGATYIRTMTDLRASLQSSLGSAYTLEHELGGGGMSRVFVAQDVRLKRRVVVKVLSPEL